MITFSVPLLSFDGDGYAFGLWCDGLKMQDLR